MPFWSSVAVGGDRASLPSAVGPGLECQRAGALRILCGVAINNTPNATESMIEDIQYDLERVARCT